MDINLLFSVTNRLLRSTPSPDPQLRHPCPSSHNTPPSSQTWTNTLFDSRQQNLIRYASLPFERIPQTEGTPGINNSLERNRSFVHVIHFTVAFTNAIDKINRSMSYFLQVTCGSFGWKITRRNSWNLAQNSRQANRTARRAASCAFFSERRLPRKVLCNSISS